MNRKFRIVPTLCLVLFATGFAAQAPAQARQEAKLLVASEVLDELRAQKDQAIPERLLQRAYAVAVIPDVNKVAFIFGGRHGSGLLSVRDSRGRFSSPVFVYLTGGGIGWQAGVEQTDVVLVFTTQRGVDNIAAGKLTLGGNASVAAGPVGRQGEAAVSIDAEVYSYSRTRGLFAGVSLDGTALTMDNAGNQAFYGRPDVLPSDILGGKVNRDTESVRRFLTALAASTGEAAPAAGPAPGNTAPPAASGTAVEGPATDGARTFPMEDTSPGQEPPR